MAPDRAVSAAGWRWMPGMRWTVQRPAPLESYSGRIGDTERQPPTPAARPDLDDAATVGCLLALVRVLWESPMAHTRQSGSIYVGSDRSATVNAWEVCDLYLSVAGAKRIGASRAGSVNMWGYASECDALVRALECAP
jgi:hypothetical protein